MSFGGLVHCSCVRDGLAPACPRGTVQLRDSGAWELLGTDPADVRAYLAWWDTPCTHPRMVLASFDLHEERQMALRRLVDELGASRFPALMGLLPIRREKLASTPCISLLAELEVVAREVGLAPGARLVDVDTGRTMASYLYRTRGRVGRDPATGYILGFDWRGVFVRDGDGNELFCAMEVVQSVVEGPPGGAALYELRDVDSGASIRTRVPLVRPGERHRIHRDEPIGDLPSHLRVEVVEDDPMTSGWDYGVPPLLGLVRAAVSSGNPILFG